MISIDQKPEYGNPDNVARVNMNYPVYVRYMQIYLITHYPDPVSLQG